MSVVSIYANHPGIKFSRKGVEQGLAGQARGLRRVVVRHAAPTSYMLRRYSCRCRLPRPWLQHLAWNPFPGLGHVRGSDKLTHLAGVRTLSEGGMGRWHLFPWGEGEKAFAIRHENCVIATNVSSLGA